MLKDKRGFTLLELIIVLIILAGLATLGIQQYQNMVWKGRFAEVYQNIGIIAKAEKMYYMMNGVYANVTNPGGESWLGNGYSIDSTNIQRQLGIGFPQASLFRYYVCPNVDDPGLKRVYFLQPGYVWCWYYDYVSETWTKDPNPGDKGPGCKYFVPPRG